jgi:hypothetical protein
MLECAASECRCVRLKVDRARDREVDGMLVVDLVRLWERKLAFPFLGHELKGLYRMFRSS